MSVELITEATDEVVAMMERLIPQLSRSSRPLTATQTREFLTQPNVYLFGFRTGEGEPLLGMLSLATFRIPTGLRAWVEDVVVDEDARGHGAGQALVEAAIAHAQTLGARTVDLTSRPTREAANRLYQRCGFELRETNVYRFAN
ncbi:MAG: GNAT family N-acetyltransferase [Actinomycetaceae bacterium]|nr:GNAT family N-acetyltransferase [Actinomycetaceae bacterium]